MQTLSVLAVEDGAIVVAAPTGERFRLPVDAALRARLTAPDRSGEERRLSPREIQAHIRSGMSAEQVAAMTGAPVAAIERFVGPVLAERAYIVESALAVRLPPETDGARSRTFGAVMGERLDALAAQGVRWSSAKEPSGWVLAVGFTADEVQHDARWRFDAKHMRLEPDNVEASTLSQQGAPAALTPRLRAIEPTAPVTVIPPQERIETPPPSAVRTAEPDRTRFDSAVFSFPSLAAGRGPDRPADEAPGNATAEPPVDTGSLPVTRAIEVVDARRTGEVFAPRPAPVEDRGEPAVEPAPREAVEPSAGRATAPVTPFRPRPNAEFRAPEPLRRRRGRAATEPTAVQDTGPVPEPAAPTAAPEPDRGASRPRRGRTSMPSWDEIVFGRDEQP